MTAYLIYIIVFINKIDTIFGHTVYCNNHCSCCRHCRPDNSDSSTCGDVKVHTYLIY